jgi:hypothetical protein
MIYLLLASVGLAVIVARLRGGRLGQLGEVTFRLWWAVPLIAIAQSILVRLPHPPDRLALRHPRPVLMIASYVILWAVVWLNRRLPGMGVVLVGVSCNLLAIAANGGYMPILPEALARLGADQAANQIPPGSVVVGSKDVLLPRQQALFWILGDILVIPEPLPWPTAMSIGDVLLAVGVFLLIVHTTLSRDTSE